MSTTFKPMLGAAIESLEALRWPLICSVKIDGIRAVTTPDGPKTRSMKPIPNRHIAGVLATLPPWLDGELVYVDPEGGCNFRDTASHVMSRNGLPNFAFMVFDYVERESLGFANRLMHMRAQPWFSQLHDHPHVVIISQKTLATPGEAERMFQDARQLGHEGLVLRSPDAPYKFGRSTLKEQGLLKMKPWADDEALVIGVTEEMQNLNAQQRNERGEFVRSSHQENKVGKGTMGTLIVEHPRFGTFEIGTGFSARQRFDFWLEPPIGLMAKFSYLQVGGYDKPRHPVFLGLRPKEDLS